MKKIFCFLTFALLGIMCQQTVAVPICYHFKRPYPSPKKHASSPNQDPDTLSFFVNPFDFIAMHDPSLEFSNCTFLDPCSSGFEGTGLNCTCVTSSFSAATNSASCLTPKKIVGQLNAPMPCCTELYIELGTPLQSCNVPPCPKSNPCGLGFCGINNCLARISDGLPHDLITCITCPFSDCDIDVTYIFCAGVCAPPGSFQRTFTLSIVDEAAADCPCP